MLFVSMFIWDHINLNIYPRFVTCIFRQILHLMLTKIAISSNDANWPFEKNCPERYTQTLGVTNKFQWVCEKLENRFYEHNSSVVATLLATNPPIKPLTLQMISQWQRHAHPPPQHHNQVHVTHANFLALFPLYMSGVDLPNLIT